MSRAIVRAVLGAALLALLLGGWVYLYTHSRAVDAGQRNRTFDLLQSIRQDDAEWTANVLRSHTDINLNYDALTKPLQPFVEKLAELRALVQPLAVPAVDQAVNDLAAAWSAKVALIDAFKAQNSLFKNSLRYVPTAHRDIGDMTRGERDAGLSAETAARRAARRSLDELEKSLAGNAQGGADAQRRVEQALAAMRGKLKAAAGGHGVPAAMMNFDAGVGLLVDEVLRYSAVPDRSTADAVRAEIDRMRAALPSHPPALQEPVANLLVHLDTLLRLRTQQAEVLRQVSQVPISGRIDTLSAELTRRFDTELATQFTFQRWLLAYSALALLLVVCAVGVILYRNATERQRLSSLVEQKTAALKENEAHLVHAQRMAAVGELVAGVAHEVNTPLAAVKSGLQSARELLLEVREHFAQSGEFLTLVAGPTPAGETERAAHKRLVTRQYERVRQLRGEIEEFDSIGTINELLEGGVHSVEHISSVVVNMLNFSRLDRTRVVSARIEESLEATLVIARHLLGKVALHKHYGDTAPVSCDVAQINQVVLNLLKNAVQAAPDEGGEIHVSTAMDGPERVRVDVRDNGSGIPAHVLPRIWEPFFTTKPEGEGTGLGLSTCRKIIAAHGGTISVESQPGRGATFSIVLPVAPPQSLYREHGQQAAAQLVPA